MQIRMLKTENGSIDGIRVASYQADAEYDLSATAGARELAAAFVGAGLAVDVNADSAHAPAGDEPVADLVQADDAAEPAPAAKPGRAKK